MTEKTKTATVKIPADIWSEIQKLKKETYFDKPYVDIYKDLMRLGIEAHKRGETLKGAEN